MLLSIIHVQISLKQKQKQKQKISLNDVIAVTRMRGDINAADTGCTTLSLQEKFNS